MSAKTTTAIALKVAPKIEDRTFNDHKPAYVDHMIERSNLSNKDVLLIKSWIEEKRSQHTKGVSQSHIQKIWYHLIIWRFMTGKNFTDLMYKSEDPREPSIIKTINDIRDYTYPDGKKKGQKRFKSQETFRENVAIIKSFLSWLVDEGKSEIKEKDLKKIKVPSIDQRRMKPDDLIDGDVKDAMIRGAMNIRDKAIVALFWDAALRPVEIGRLKVCDLEFTDTTMYIYVKEKTNRMRRIPCPLAANYVKQWFNTAPYPMVGDALVFPCLHPKIIEERQQDGTIKITKRYLPMRSNSLRVDLKRIAKQAGITKYHFAYQFRHTTITRMLDAGIPERQVMQISHGGDTRMFKRYYTPDDLTIEDSINEKIHGLPSRKEREAKREREAVERICPNCGTVHDATFRFCGKCGTGLTEEARENKKNTVQILDEIAMNHPQTAVAALAEMQKEIAALRNEIAEVKGTKQG
jgi:integrase/ribosomal protein S27AE